MLGTHDQKLIVTVPAAGAAVAGAAVAGAAVAGAAVAGAGAWVAGAGAVVVADPQAVISMTAINVRKTMVFFIIFSF